MGSEADGSFGWIADAFALAVYWRETGPQIVDTRTSANITTRKISQAVKTRAKNQK